MSEDQRANPLHSLSDYDFAHLFDHLAASQSASDAFAILSLSTGQRRNAWFDAQFARNNISGFIRDVQTAWRLSDIKSDSNDCDPSESIVREIQCALMISSVNTALGELPPEVLAAAAQTGVWSVQEALAIAMQPLDWALRLRCVAALIPFLLKNDASSIELLFSSLRGRPGEERSRSFVDIDRNREGTDDAPDFMDEHLKTTIFERLASLFPEGAVEKAVEIAEGIKTPWGRSIAVASVAPRLREEVRQAVMNRTVECVRGIGKLSLRAECLARLSPKMPEPKRTAVLDEAWQLQIAASTGHPDEDRFALTSKSGVLKVLVGTTWLEETTCGLRLIAAQFDEARLLNAIEQSRKFRPQYRELSLMCLAPRLAAFGRQKEALKIVEKEIVSAYPRLIASLEVDLLDEAGDRSKLSVSRLKEAEALDNQMIRARAKVLVGKVYPEIVTVELINEALSACEQVVDDTSYKALQIKGVVSALHKATARERSRIAARALKICQSVTDCEQDDAMHALMGVLSEDVIKKTILNLSVVDTSTALRRFQKVAALLSHEPATAGTELEVTPWDDELVAASVDALSEIVNTANLRVNPEDLKEYGERGAASRKVRRYGDAEAWARMFASDEDNQRVAVAGYCAIYLAPRLGPVQALRASESTGQLRDFYWRSSGLIALSDRMVEPEATENILAAMESACRLKDDRLLLELFSQIAKRLTQPRLPAVHRIWNECLMTLSRDNRSYVIGFLQSSIPMIWGLGSERAVLRAADVAEIVENWWKPQDVRNAKRGKSGRKAPSPSMPAMFRMVGDGEPTSTIVGGYGWPRAGIEAGEIESASLPFTAMLDSSAVAAVLSALSRYFVANNLENCAAKCKKELFNLLKENSTNDTVLQHCVEFIAAALDSYGKRKLVSPAIDLYNEWFRLISVGDPRKRLMAATVSFGAIYACCEAGSFGPAQDILARLISMARLHKEEDDLQRAVAIAHQQVQRSFKRSEDSRAGSPTSPVRRAGSFGPVAGTKEKVSKEFNEALQRAGMTFAVPQGFKIAKVPSNDPLRPLQILKSKKHLVYAYYFIRTAEAGLSTDLNGVFWDTLNRVSLGKVGPLSRFPDAAVRTDFRADRGGTRSLHVNPHFPGSLKEGMGVVLQADGLAEALVLIMFTDFIEARSIVHDAFYSLKFAPPADAE